MQLTKNTAICDTCGELIKRSPNQIKRANHHFCNNIECRAVWQSSFMKGSTYNQDFEFMKKGDKKKCRKCCNIKPLKDFSKNKGGMEGLNSWCKQCVSKNGSRYYADKRDGILGNRRKVGKIKPKESSKRKKHPAGVSAILLKLRTRINDIVKRTRGAKKCAKTIELIGCSPVELREHLQRTAIKNGYLDFDITNYDGMEYHIDHIKPCIAFNMLKKEEQRACFHYTNLQILTAKENLIKNETY